MNEPKSNRYPNLPPNLSEKEYTGMMASKNPFTQIKLLRINMRTYGLRFLLGGDRPKSARILNFKTLTTVLICFFAVFGGVTRRTVNKLKNDDYAEILAEQEVRRMMKQRLQ